MLALLAYTWAMGTGRQLPDPAPANAPDSAFSSARAMSELVEIARAPRPTGSPEHARVRAHLLDRMTELGLHPTLQTTTAFRQVGSRIESATVRNIVARLPGEESTGAVAVTAHYDSRHASPGAGDDGSGVVAILEVLRALASSSKLRNDIIVLFTDAEELGLFGAQAFVNEHPWMAEIAVVLSLEARGAGGPSIMFETGTQNGWIVSAAAAGDPAPFANSLSFEVYRRLSLRTDFTRFQEVGTQGLNYAAIGRGSIYHQARDTPANLHEATLQHHGLHLLGMVRYLGGSDLSSVDAPDRVFFHLPFLGLLSYPPSWVVPITAWLLMTLVLTALLAWRRGAGASGILVGAAIGVACTGAAAAVGAGLFRWLVRHHPEYGALHGASFYSEGWYVLALAAAVLSLVATSFALARRRFSLAELSLGAAVVPTLAAVVATVIVPLGAMNLQWPIAFAVLSIVLVTGSSARGPGRLAWTLLLLLALPILAFLGPLIELLWATMSFSMAPALGVLVAWTLLLLCPVLDAVRAPNPWWVPVGSLVFAAGFLGIGVLDRGVSADHPIPSTLFYAFDHQSGRALWATRNDAGLPWARQKVGALDSEQSLEAFQLGASPFLVGSAPVVDAPPPRVTMRVDEVAGAQRRIRVRVRSELGAEALSVQIVKPGEARILAVNERSVVVSEGGPGQPPNVRLLTHWGEPEGDVVLDVETPVAADGLLLEVVEQHLRPAELLGEAYFSRDPEFAPNTMSRSDRAFLRTSLALPMVDTAAGSPLAAERPPQDR